MSDVPYLDRLGDELERAITPTPPPRRSWGPIAAAAGFAVVIGAGLVWWAVGAGSRTPRPDPVATTTTAVTPTTPPTPTTLPPAAALPAEWARVPGVEALAGSGFVTLNAVVAGPSGFLAAGTASAGGELGAALVVESADGVSWAAVPAAGLEGAFVNDLAVGGDGTVVAVGGEIDGAPRPRFWRFDGTTWAPGEAAPAWPAAQANVVIATATGFVAAGSAYDDARRLDVQSGVVWVSADGSSWEVRRPDAFIAPLSADIGALATLDGRVVAGGLWSAAESASEAAVWFTDDLADWQRVTLPSESSGFAGVQGIAPGGPGLVAVGFEQRSGTVAAVWTSGDGESWDRVPHDPIRFGGTGFADVRMSAVAAVPGGLVAAGFESSGSRTRKLIWTSTDGLEWQRFDLAGPPIAGGETVAFDVAAVGSTVAVVGAELAAGSEEAVAAAWVSPVPAGVQAEQPRAAPPPPGPPDVTTVEVEPATATVATGMLVNIDGPPQEDDVVWMVGPDGGAFEACTAAARGGRQRWCRFRPGDIGITEVGTYAVALDDPGDPVPGVTVEIVAAGSELVRLDGVYTPFLHPLVQQLSIRNDGDQPLDLTGWSVQAPRSGQQQFAFPAGSALEPGQAAIIYQGGPGGGICMPDGPRFFRTCNHFEGGVGATAYWTGGAVLVDSTGDVRAEWAPPG